jgi:hypothetical protein
MSLKDRISSELKSHPPGVPIAVGLLAERLKCSTEEVLAIGAQLQHRVPGDDQLVTMVTKADANGAHEVYLSRQPLALNDEPETR